MLVETDGKELKKLSSVIRVEKFLATIEYMYKELLSFVGLKSPARFIQGYG
jgi:hypothetical protein